MIKFSLPALLNQMKHHPEKHKILKVYEQFHGKLAGKKVHDLDFYNEHVCFFQPLIIRKPIHSTDLSDDYMLLMQLAVSSFSINYYVQFDRLSNLPELVLVTNAVSGSVTCCSSHLTPFHIMMLFEIFIEEQIRIANILKVNENERDTIISARQVKLQAWNKVLARIKRDNNATIYPDYDGLGTSSLRLNFYPEGQQSTTNNEGGDTTEDILFDFSNMSLEDQCLLYGLDFDNLPKHALLPIDSMPGKNADSIKVSALVCDGWNDYAPPVLIGEYKINAVTKLRDGIYIGGDFEIGFRVLNGHLSEILT